MTDLNNLLGREFSAPSRRSFADTETQWDRYDIDWLIAMNRLFGALSAALYPIAFLFVFAAGHTFPLSFFGPLECVVGFVGGLAMLNSASLLTARTRWRECKISTLLACCAGGFITITNALLVLFLSSPAYHLIPLDLYLSLPFGLALLFRTLAVLNRPFVRATFGEDCKVRTASIAVNNASNVLAIEDYEERLWQARGEVSQAAGALCS